MMDEATANVDNKTDELIQLKIREHFSDSTIITIAHRLNTIADYDKVVFVEDGKVVEVGAPIYLLAQDPLYSQFVDKDSYFAELVKESGHAEEIFQIAKKKYMQGLL